MRFPLTEKVIDEARRFNLRSACRDCFYCLPQDGRCGLGWPNREQAHWPIDAPLPDGGAPETIAFCKEFELR